MKNIRGLGKVTKVPSLLQGGNKYGAVDDWACRNVEGIKQVGLKLAC